jgi:hypothetical protein
MIERFDFGPVSPYRSRSMKRLGTIVLGALLVAAPALAETPETGTDKGAAPDSGEPSTATPAELLEGSARMQQDVRNALRRANELLGEARAAKDIVQLNCVNQKLTQIKGLVKITDVASVALPEALANGKTSEAGHQYKIILVAHQKALVLNSEASQCVGESTIYSGDTEIEVKIDGSATGEDPTEPKTPGGAPIVPTVASGS